MKVCEDEKEIPLNQNQELQEELESIKVSVAHIHPSVQYYHISYLWPTRDIF